jgi:hypothetical protein
MPKDDPLIALGVPQAAAACARGDIQSPVITWDAPAGWYGHPPALLPVWSDGSRPRYLGYWRHWFVDREPCFVKMYVTAGRATFEVARTAEQLFCVLAMDALALSDGTVTGELQRFAAAVGLKNLADLRSLALASGDNPKGFRKLSQFRSQCPLDSVGDSDAYDGDFPRTDRLAADDWWNRCCSFELADRDVVWPPGVVPPAWLDRAVPQKDTFARVLRAGMLDQAWLCLNSTGWEIADARAAIQQLRDAAHDPQFDVLTESWLSVADPSFGGAY